ncbi:hypothetical protein IEQ34_017993 [Dendrobium chrysotoxum]|uniref:Haloacid dehalogenase-like hydrolase domain-containing protein n=1 Tax=Dendrobium chrysotoxum TaxID=161865 RepID=A0AAV7GCS5_DENCH|nr:hypothetical protein IEQ34_017993 [Dendrobium chrysotoxum]
MASTSHLILPTGVRADFSRRREGPLCLPATIRNFPSPRRLLPHPLRASPPTLAAASTTSSLQALIFDCDGVILESEHLHRQAYNEAFAHFSVRCPVSSPKPLYWGSDFYDELQNRIGGGKPKMRWYFKENGWPSSSIYAQPPLTDSDRETLIDVIQDWKTERYKEIIKSGAVEPRPGVLRLMDDAKGAGIKVAVCSAATKSSVVLCLENLLGLERFHGLDCFLAGDDVKEKKPSPLIYLTASEKLGVSGGNCLVVEDSVIGLQAATGARMPCIVTYTSSTANQDFKEAIATYSDLRNVSLPAADREMRCKGWWERKQRVREMKRKRESRWMIASRDGRGRGVEEAMG